MKLIFLSLQALLLLLLIPLSSLHAANDPNPKPNIVFFFTDDQGYGDISAHGNPILKTPHLDRLRAQSVRFEDFHVSPTCAPTRSALFTGRHEFKNGITHTILERERLTPKAITLAQVLRDTGYTTGIFGKWHLGDEKEYLPNARGFDEMFIHGAGGIGQVYPGSCGDAPGNKYFDPAILQETQKGDAAHCFVKRKGLGLHDDFALLRWGDATTSSKMPGWNVLPCAQPSRGAIAPASPFLQPDSY